VLYIAQDHANTRQNVIAGIKLAQHAKIQSSETRKKGKPGAEAQGRESSSGLLDKGSLFPALGR
jgi:hypothetical protein